jgi:pyruvate kinase
MFIATLPAIHEQALMTRIVAHPSIDGVRYNTGSSSPYSALETLKRITGLTQTYNKTLWIDLKGRQLRIKKWSYPKYGGQIILNHEIEIDGPGIIHFRGGGSSELKVVRGSTVYVDPPPQQALGEGQAINITGTNVTIKGYLTEEDRDYIAAACQLGLRHFMLSYVEQDQDIDDVDQVIEKSLGSNTRFEPHFVLKIESRKGLEYVRQRTKHTHQLMAARDDLMIEIGENKARVLQAVEEIVRADPEAICASQLFSSLAREGELSLGDLADIALMENLGYKHFLLSSGVCRNHFDHAMKIWQDYRTIFETS